MATKPPTVSILLNAYNGQTFISEQIISILNQTFPDFELIIIDDASTDNTPQVIKKFLKDSRIKFCQNSKNLGLNASFIKGLDLCRSEYITLADNDNFWLPTRLEELLDCFKSHPGTLLAFHDSIITDEQLITVKDSFKNSLRGQTWSLNRLSPTDLSLNNLLYANIVPGVALIFHRALLPQVKLLPKTLIHDHWIALNAAAISDIHYLDKKLIKYRVHSHNLVGAASISNTFYFQSLLSPTTVAKFIKSKLDQISHLKLLLKQDISPTSQDQIRKHLSVLSSLISIYDSRNIIQSLYFTLLSILTLIRTNLFRYLKYSLFLFAHSLLSPLTAKNR